MGLYSNARKLLHSREKQKETHTRIIDYSPGSGNNGNPAYDDSSLVPIVEQITAQIDPESRFSIVSVSLGKIIEGIRNAAPESKKNGMAAEVVGFIIKAASHVAHPFQISEDTMIIVFQSIESIDMELFIHQLYNSLKNYFAGCPVDGCSIMKSRARIFPQDGSDMTKLLREVL
jgi:hypothetical protein